MLARLVGIVLVAALTTGCSGVRVSTDFDRRADLQSLRTFAWSNTERERTGDLRVDSPFLAERIEAAVENALAARGMRKVDAESADVLVEFHVGIDTRLDAVEIPSTFGWGPYWGPHWGGFYGSRVRVDQYETSTIVIDLVAPDGKRLWWRGSGESRLRDFGTPEQRNARVQRTVDAILKQFPPRR